MSNFTLWSTSELLVLFEAIQHCQKTNQNDWECVSTLMKQTMNETGMQMTEKYNGFGCAAQYNSFDIKHRDDAARKEMTIVDYAIAHLRKERIRELEVEIREREAHIFELKNSLF